MRPLTPREKRMLIAAAIAVPIYLAGFYGLQGVKLLEAKRAEYGQLCEQAVRLEVEILREEGKAKRLEKLKKLHRLDLDKLRQETIVGEASAAIQKAAQANGLKLGPSKEMPGRATDKELAVIQIEGVGATPGAAQFVHSLGAIGYPLLVEWMQLNTAGMKPGQVKLFLSLVVLNPAAWRPPAAQRADSTLNNTTDNPAEKKGA